MQYRHVWREVWRDYADDLKAQQRTLDDLGSAIICDVGCDGELWRAVGDVEAVRDELIAIGEGRERMDGGAHPGILAGRLSDALEKLEDLGRRWHADWADPDEFFEPPTHYRAFIDVEDKVADLAKRAHHFGTGGEPS